MEGLVFYEAAAQIIPVLLIVVGIEARAFDVVGSKLVQTVGSLLLGYIFFAELIALTVLSDGDAAGWEHTVVYVAIVAELSFVVALANPLMRRPPSKDGDTGDGGGGAAPSDGPRRPEGPSAEAPGGDDEPGRRAGG